MLINTNVRVPETYDGPFNPILPCHSYDLLGNWFPSLSSIGVLKADSSVASTIVLSRKAPVSVARNRIENLLCQATRMTDQSRYWAALPISTLSMNIQVVFFEFPVFPKFPKTHCSEKWKDISSNGWDPGPSWFQVYQRRPHEWVLLLVFDG